MTEDPPLEAIAALVARIAQTLRAGDDGDVRAQAAADVAQLDAVLARSAPGAPAAFDLAPIHAALRALGDWLRVPTADHEARAERAVGELEATLGARVGRDPARADADARARYRREARAALDDIFGGKPKPKP